MIRRMLQTFAAMPRTIRKNTKTMHSLHCCCNKSSGGGYNTEYANWSCDPREFFLPSRQTWMRHPSMSINFNYSAQLTSAIFSDFLPPSSLNWRRAQKGDAFDVCWPYFFLFNKPANLRAFVSATSFLFNAGLM